MKDIWQSIKSSLSQRLDSPFLGTFCLSFLFFNWRGIEVFLFSNNPIEQRVSYIEQIYCLPLYYFWLPLATALFYTFGHPVVLLWISRYLVYIEKIKESDRQSLKLVEAQNEAQLVTKAWETTRLARQRELEGMKDSLFKAKYENLMKKVTVASGADTLASASKDLELAIESEIKRIDT
jgi:hypothetical protein